jgi:hypothetical protein
MEAPVIKRPVRFWLWSPLIGSPMQWLIDLGLQIINLKLKRKLGRCVTPSHLIKFYHLYWFLYHASSNSLEVTLGSVHGYKAAFTYSTNYKRKVFLARALWCGSFHGQVEASDFNRFVRITLHYNFVISGILNFLLSLDLDKYYYAKIS